MLAGQEERRAALLAELRRGAGTPELQALAGKLVAEFDEWEEIRARMKLERVEPTATDMATKTILLFDGLPGAGKTTQIGLLQSALGAAHFSMAEYARTRDIAQGDRRHAQLATLALHPGDEAFLEAVRSSPALTVILEKFPRTPVEARAFVNWARANQFRIEVCFFEFPSDVVNRSVERQLSRGARRGKAITAHFAAERALKNLARSSSGRWALEALGVSIHRIGATHAIDENARRIREVIVPEPSTLGFELDTLRTLHDVASRLGIEAWVGAGHFYRPFWNGRFGPIQRPSDVDVAVDREGDVEPLLRALEHAHPNQRWSVIAPGVNVVRELGIVTTGAREAKAFTRLLHRGGLVRWNGAELELHFAPGAEASLRGGMLTANEALLARLDDAARAKSIARIIEKIPRTLSDYPGLGIDARTLELLGGAFGPRAPKLVTSGWQALKERVAHERGQRMGTLHNRRALSDDERAVADEILQLHRASPMRAEGPLPPRSVHLPDSLSGDDAGHTLVPPPVGFASWLEHLALDANDEVFRAWLHDQVHHHGPRGGADPFVRALLDFSLFEPALSSAPRTQSAMHQGWTLERHLAASALELDTARAIELSNGTIEPRRLRLAMRMAMLFHDTGKLAGPHAPRRHPSIGARLFAMHRPPWFPEPLVTLTQWMIESHDLFGALGRGLTEKCGHPIANYELNPADATSYPDALDSQAVRARLLDSKLPMPLAVVIARAIWCADIGSIAALRWLLPIARLVEKLLLCAPAARVRRAW